jgi:23S rRNA (adenine2503-C2)-methyltransferase
MVKNSLCGLTADEIFSLIEPSGYNYTHAVSISNSIYKKRISHISGIVKVPKKLISKLSDNYTIGTFNPAGSEKSKDKSVKYLFRTETGKEFETVYIPDNKRHTVCVSTQSGCRMGCRLCATAKYGFRGNLSTQEIIGQIIGIPEAGRVTHIVFMGMGEPMDNLENVLKACLILTSEWGFAISPRNVTVSSVGITPAIEKFLLFSECNLTLSIFSPFVEERKSLVPIENQYPVKKILDMIKSYPVKKRRRLSLAYVMIKNFNDSDIHLEEIKKLVKGSLVRVNLLPYHQTSNDDLYVCSPAKRMQFFKHDLVLSGVSASIRKSRGSDISAACGLLAIGLDRGISACNK